MTISPRYLSRKLLVTAAVLATGIVALFTDKMDDVQFVALATLVMTIYVAGNVAQKKVQGRDPHDDP